MLDKKSNHLALVNILPFKTQKMFMLTYVKDY